MSKKKSNTRNTRKTRKAQNSNIRADLQLSNYSLIPEVTRLRLDYFAATPIAGALSPLIIPIGILDPTSRLPKYWNRMFGLYRYAYIEKIAIKLEISNIGTNPFSVVLAQNNITDIGTATMKNLEETPKSKTRQCITSGNRSVVSLNFAGKSDELIGKDVSGDHDYWNTASTGVSVSYTPCIALGVEPTIIGGAIDYVRTVRVEYYVKFHTLNLI